MSLTYVHLSDIHFGQERGAEVYVHEDVKDRLLDDVAAVKEEAGIKRIDGVIVTGDVAFSWQEERVRSSCAMARSADACSRMRKDRRACSAGKPRHRP